MGERVRIIIDADPAVAAEALEALLRRKSDFSECKVGWGWGLSRTGGPKFFARRTKTGFSITQDRDQTDAR